MAIHQSAARARPGSRGYVVEVAVLYAATGEVLLDTLVSPGCTTQPGAR
jgi:hypothetical protein